jgi:SAM-dependent MidA family methyltransferase
VREPVPWREAWQSALYGSGGFYRQPGGPAGHFTTAAHSGAGRALAEALWSWADRLGLDGIVDVGAGRGELLGHLYASGPDRPLLGLDVVDRPLDLPPEVDWVQSPGGADLPHGALPRRSLVVAQEWLDVVPCTIAEVAPDGTLREVFVVPETGIGSFGPSLSEPDLLWCQRFWPSGLGADAQPGDRVEVGRQRDEAWMALLARLGDSVALAIDYGHEVGDRPRRGSLAAYRSGHSVEPIPDGSCDLTAHVAVDSPRQTRRLRQHDALEGLPAPDPALARSQPAAYLKLLARRSEVATLRRFGGLGDFWWVFAEP